MQLLMFRNAEGRINPITPTFLTAKKSDLIIKPQPVKQIICYKSKKPCEQNCVGPCKNDWIK